MLNKLKEKRTKKKMKTFENVTWDAEWKKIIENRKNNPNRKNELATEEELENIYKKLKGDWNEYKKSIIKCLWNRAFNKDYW